MARGKPSKTVRYTKSGVSRTATLDADRMVTVRTEHETFRTTLDGWGELVQSWVRYGWRQDPRSNWQAQWMGKVSRKRPLSGLPRLTGPERWEKTLSGQPAWVEIRYGNLRNELGDRWTETHEQIRKRREDLWRDGWLRVGLTEYRPQTAPSALGEQILDAALRLGHGRREVPIPITKLRSQIAAVRSDFDDAVKALHDQRRVVLTRNDNTAALTEDDREDAIWVGDQPRHLIYVLD